MSLNVIARGRSLSALRSTALFVLFVAGVSVASCSERIEAGGSCPLLCPQEAAPLNDTILLDAVTLDTSLAGFPPAGFESNLMLAKRGDTLDTRVILRYDSLPTTYSGVGGDAPITRIDSAYIRGVVPTSDTSKSFHGPTTIQVYDVTDAANDTTTASLAAQFTPGNLIGSRDFATGDSPDTVIILIDTARVRSRILNGQNLRLGLRLVTAGSEQIRFESRQISTGFYLIYHPDRDPAVSAVQFQVQSQTPTDIPFLRGFYSDFTIAVVGGLPPANTIRAGGYPAQRVLLHFHLPRFIVDSTEVIRATLILTQRPSGAPEAGDTAVVRIAPIVASNEVTDLREVLQFTGAPQSFPLDSLVVFPKDSGRRDLQMVNLVRAWRGQDTLRTPRRAALYIASEQSRTAGVDFFSMEAAPSLRPRLRITYVTKVSSGRP